MDFNKIQNCIKVGDKKINKISLISFQSFRKIVSIKKPPTKEFQLFMFFLAINYNFMV